MLRLFDKILGIRRPADFTQEQGVLPWLREQVYRRGFKPKPGTILFSPSRALLLYSENPAQDLIRGMQQAENRYGVAPVLCTQSTCKEIQIHAHGPECHFTCYCEKGQCCYDSRE